MTILIEIRIFIYFFQKLKQVYQQTPSPSVENQPERVSEIRKIIQ